MINVNERGKHLRDDEEKGTLAEKKNIAILGSNTIKHVNGYGISKKLENCKVFQELRLDV